MADKSNVFTLIFFCNGQKVTAIDVDPKMNLLTFLRSKLLLKGTKDGCSQGGCGACTVMVSRYDSNKKKILHQAVTACLTPVCSVHGMAITTVEGIGSNKDKLHPVQECIAKAHGSQCGFCTPGFVMSMYTLLRNNPTPTMDDIQRYLEGNLCRCTGYRPILEGYQTFTQGCCGSKKSGGCCLAKKDIETKDGVILSTELFRTEDIPSYDPSQEIIFPPELLVSSQQNGVIVFFCGERVTWYSPTTVKDVLLLKATHKDARIVAGNTQLGLVLKEMEGPYPDLISCTGVAALQDIKVQDNGFLIGAAATLEHLEIFMKEQINCLPEYQTKVCSAFVELLKQYSSQQIKNVATLGGHVASASPGSDLNPLLMAAGAEVHLSSSTASRKVKLDENFFPDKFQISIKSDEIITAVFIPFTEKNEYIHGFKQSDGTVKAGFRVRVGEGSIVKDIIVAVGGMAATYKVATAAMATFVNRKWNKELLEVASDSLTQLFALPAGVYGGMETYRQSIPASLFFKFFLKVSQKLPSEMCEELDIPQSWLSAGRDLPPGEFKSTQMYQEKPHDQPSYDSVGRPIIFKSALQQATGEALYGDDIPKYENELSMALVFSKKAHANVLGIDYSEAMSMEGVHDVITAADVPGTNVLGDNEVLFADRKVTSVGQVIACVVAKNSVIARRAARLVKVNYEDLELILSIEDAIEKESYFCSPITLHNGDVEAGFGKSDFVFEGEVGTGAQEHMYMEPHNALAIPKGEHEEMDITVSTQDLNGVLSTVSAVLGVVCNRVVCRTKRVGGAFGGKLMTSARLAAFAAVAANKTNRPVRVVLDRKEDMQSTGTRHPYLAKYKVGCTKDGKVVALDLKMWSNCGYILGESTSVMIASQVNIDMGYKLPNVSLIGYLCKTNLPSCTALRGFGVPQIQAITETWMTHLAVICGLSQQQVREVNLYQEGDITYTNQLLTGCTLQKCWTQCLKQSEFEIQKEKVTKFNSQNRWKKRGIAINPTKFIVGHGHPAFNPEQQGGALVLIYLDGSVLITHGGIEFGQGLYTKMIQVASKVLEVPVEKVHITETATDKVPNAISTGGSFTTDLCGFALKDACKTLVKRLQPFKSANPDGTWEDWVIAAYSARVSLSSTGSYSVNDMDYDPETNKGRLRHYFSYGVAVCEVEVDCLTGSHKLLRTDIVMDVGDSLNPAVDIGQIEGGFVQGYGMYALEDYRWSSSGHLLTNGPGPYKVPTVSDIIGEFNVSLLHNVPNPRAIFSSKGIGEPPLLLGSTVLFAIWDAVASARADAGLNNFFTLNIPAVSEQVRLACQDEITQKCSKPQPGTYAPSFYRW